MKTSNMKGGLEPASINLLKNSKFMSNTVRGAIGEIIAWQYLTKKFYPSFVQSLQGAIPCQGESYWKSPCGPPTDGQRQYLAGHFGHSWDFIATDYSQKPPTTYLVEVKTSGQHTSTRPPPSWHDRGKLPPIREIERVKRLGFAPILLKVHLREDWEVKISCVHF